MDNGFIPGDWSPSSRCIVCGDNADWYLIPWTDDSNADICETCFNEHFGEARKIVREIVRKKRKERKERDKPPVTI